MRLAVFLLALVSGACSAHAQIPLLSGPVDPGTAQATLNVLISQINSITHAVAGVPNSVLATGDGALTIGSAGAVNQLTITGGMTGFPAVIDVGGSAADANAGLRIAANGSGDIALLTGGTGVLRFDNQASFVPAVGLGSCPSVPNAKSAPLGVHTNIQGFLAVKDWLGRSRYVPVC